MKRLIAAILFVVVSPLLAGAEESWIGQKIFLKHDAKIKVEDQETEEKVDIAKLQFPLVVFDEEEEMLSVVPGLVLKSDAMLADQALEYYTEHVRQNPADVTGWNFRGMIWVDKDQLDRAVDDFSEAIRLDPKNVLPYHYRGKVWAAKQDYDKAIADHDEEIRLDPGRAVAFVARGLAWAGKDEHDKAIDDYCQAIKLEPDNLAAFYYRGQSWQDKGELRKAIDDFDQAIELGMYDAAVYYLRGVAYYDDGQYANAIDDFGNAIELGLGVDKVYCHRGIAYRYNEQPAEAIWDQTMAIWLDADEPCYYYERANVWRGAGSTNGPSRITLGPSTLIRKTQSAIGAWQRLDNERGLGPRDRRLHPGHRTRPQRVRGVSLSWTGLACQKRVRQSLRRL